MKKPYAIGLTVLFCLFIGGFGLATLLSPDRDFSPLENRYLSQLPSLDAKDFELDWPIGDSGDFFTGEYMSDVEDYVTDQFFARDQWIALKSYSEKLLGKDENNGVYLGSDDTLFPRFDQPDEKRVDSNLNYVSTLGENLDIPVYFSLIPGKLSVWSDRLPTGAPNASEEDYLTLGQQVDNVTWVDIAQQLNSHSQEDIFYRLDHHWSSLGAYYGYVALMESMGIEPVSIDDYEKTTVSTDFNGTTFSSSGVRWMEPDSIDIYVPDTGITVESWFGASAEVGNLYAWDKLEEQNQYPFFMGGNQSLAIISTQQTEAPKVLVIRDSYTDTLVPFLTPHFSEIHLYDARYNKTPISQYVIDNDIDAVVVLYSVSNFVTDTNLFVLSK